MVTLLQALGVFFAVWYGVTFAAAFYQECRVGWPKFQRKGRTLFFIAGMMIAGTLHQFLCLAVYLVAGANAGRKTGNYLMSSFYSFFGPLVWGELQIEGREHLPPGEEGVLYLANHQCSVDFCLVFSLPNKPHVVGVAKKEMLALPGFGLMTYLAGGIFITRGKKGTLANLIDQAGQRLKVGMSVGIFPQGTRSVPVLGKPTKPFKIGSFVLAVKTKARIVPLTFLYPQDFMLASSSGEGPKIIIHKPVQAAEGETPEELMTRVEKTIMKPIQDRLALDAPEQDKKRD